MTDTHLAQAVYATNEASSYDTNIKLIMTTELEGRMQTMCNWSEAIKEISFEEGIKKGMEKGIVKERLNAVERMIRAGATKEQIVSFGYTEKEFAEAENILCANA